jgi:hypothetical protein
MPKKTKDLLLAMDVGNTNTVLGVYRGPDMVCDWRIRTEKDGTLDEMGLMIGNLFASRCLETTRVFDLIHDQFPGGVQPALFRVAAALRGAGNKNRHADLL